MQPEVLLVCFYNVQMDFKTINGQSWFQGSIFLWKVGQYSLIFFGGLFLFMLLFLFCLFLLLIYTGFQLCVFMRFLCLPVCVFASTCVSCTLLCFSAHLFVWSYSVVFGFVLSYFIITVCRHLFVSNERNQERMWIWVGEEVGRIWEEIE